MDKVTGIKTAYNKQLERFWRAETYMDDNIRSPEERMMYIPHFQAIQKDLSSMLLKLKDMGIEHTEDEVLNGFKLDLKKE